MKINELITIPVIRLVMMVGLVFPETPISSNILVSNRVSLSVEQMNELNLRLRMFSIAGAHDWSRTLMKAPEIGNN